MAKQYSNIRNLLIKGFTSQELRTFCFDTDEFRAVYDKTTTNTDRTRIAHLIIEHAEQRNQFEVLLAWAKSQNPDKYAEYGPYNQDTPHIPSSDPPPPDPPPLTESESGEKNLWLVSANGKRHHLHQGSMIIGRSRVADIQIHSPTVSARHAILEFDGRTCIIEDEKSTKGTFVNGQRINKPVQFNPGDELKIGDQIFTLVNYASSNPSTPPKYLRWVIVVLLMALAIAGVIVLAYMKPESNGHTPTPTNTATQKPTSPPNSSTPTLTNTPATPTDTYTPTQTPLIQNTPLFTPTPVPILAANEVGIAFQVNFSNTNRSTVISNSIRMGYDDFRKEFNFKQEFGFEVKLLLPFNDEGKKDIAVKNAYTIMNNPQILCVLGHGSSSAALGALEEHYNPSNILVISPNNTAQILTQGPANSDKVFYRLVGRDDVQTVLAVKKIKELFSNLSPPRVYFIRDGTSEREAYGKGIEETFRTVADGLNIIAYDVYSETTDVVSLAQQVNKEQPELVYYAGYPKEAVEIFAAIRKDNPDVRFFGPDALDSTDMIKTDANKAVLEDKLYYTTVGAPPNYFEAMEQKVKDYEDRYDEPPGSFFGESYDGVRLCMTAIWQAAQKRREQDNQDLIPTRPDVLQQIQKIFKEGSKFTGISGEYQFTEMGDPLEASYCVGQVLKGVTTETWSDNIQQCFFCFLPESNSKERCRVLKKKWPKTN